MSFKKMIAQRLFAAFKNRRLFTPAAALNHQTGPKKIAPDPGDDGIFRRYLHRHTAASPSGSRPFFPAGDKLLGKLRGMDTASDRIRLDGMRPPPEKSEEESPEGKMTAADARKILRSSQLETVKLKLRKNEKDCVSYSEFMGICGKESLSKDQGLEFAKILDESGSVIVLGNIVFLRPEKVIKAIQGLLMPIISPNNDDSTTKALQELEKRKAAIDKKAKLYVRRELWCGLGYLLVQTALFMRLTFWELSWDVMEPICFYVTSMYFMGGYAFFLRTSEEPSFEGFYKSRLSARRRRLMKNADFDAERYNELKKARYSQSLAIRM